MHSLLSDVVFLSKKHPLKKATVGNKLEVQLMDAYCAAKGTPSEIVHKKDGISGNKQKLLLLPLGIGSRTIEYMKGERNWTTSVVLGII